MESDKKKSILKVVEEYIKIIAVSFVLSGIIMCFFRTTKVEGISMENTLQDNDILLLNRISYKIKSPEYKDIVVIDTFREKNKFIIKRVIAVGGDTFEIKDNMILVNHKEIEEEYIKQGKETQYEDFGEIRIPEGEIFVMGDNRSESADSRVFGLFNWEEQVLGKIMVGIKPFKSKEELSIKN